MSSQSQLSSLQQTFASNLLTSRLTTDLRTKAELERKLDEYDKLGRELGELAKHSKKEVMVPISDVAFFRGHIKHSNEILVFLGDNYFAERTVHECQGIIQRRQDKIQEQIESLEVHVNREEQLIETFKEQTVEGDQPPLDDLQTRWTKEGCLDIREPDQPTITNTNQSSDSTKDLDEEEDFDKQFESLKKKAIENKHNQKAVKTTLSQEDMRKMMISSQQYVSYSAGEEEHKKQQQQQQPKSILKKPTNNNNNNNSVPLLTTFSTNTSQQQAIIGQVVERNPQQQLIKTTITTPTNTTTTTQQQPSEEEAPKRVSKFKQQRMQQ